MKKSTYQHFLTSSLALSLVAGLSTQAQATHFTDIKTSDWFYSAVTEMEAKGFVSGTSSVTYSPNDSLTIGQFSALIANAFYGNSVQDNSSDWWEKFVTACDARGAYSGTSFDGTQSWLDVVNTDISRYDMVVMISNLMAENQVSLLSETEITAALARLNDTVPTQYQTAVATAFHHNFLTGKDGDIFDGSASLLRSEAASVLATLVNSSLISVEQVVQTTQTVPTTTQVTEISLSNSQVLVDGSVASENSSSAVYVSHDILFYVDTMDFTYGAASAENMHAQSLADAHTVVNITRAGTYSLSGSLSLGQIAINLGENASTDPTAVVTILLNGVDVTCEVAPALIFYNVYEACADTLTNPTRLVDTTAAGANVVIADDTTNSFVGSHVARIYKPESVVLSADGTSVSEYKTLYKYDGAFYSKMSLNVSGEQKGNGILNIYADNEGLDSELHLTINGGIININSGNDGINTNEDNISVTTVNGGALNIFVHGQTGEGDGIDSNGWIVINGGSIFAQACTLQGSMAAGWMGDAGIDSDLGIHINGGTIFATGHMLDDIALSEQTYAVFIINDSLPAGTYQVKDINGTVVAQQYVTNSFTYLIVSFQGMTIGDYTLWNGETLLSTATARTDGLSSHGQSGGMERPEGMMPEDMFPDGMMPEDMFPDGMMPEDMFPDGMMPDGMMRPEGMMPLV